MSILKKLAGQTAIYGLPSIVGRLINFLLVFLFTQYFDPEVFAAHTEFYAYAAFFLVLLPHGMETAYFNFIRRGEEVRKVFGTSFVSILLLALLFLGLSWSGKQGVADFMGYGDHPEYVWWFALILFADVLATIPFAALRHRQKAGRFAMIRSTGIFVNIALNVLFIVYFPRWYPEGSAIYDPGLGIGYVFLANLYASGIMLLLLAPTIRGEWGPFDGSLWRSMMRYAWPLIFVGLAGIVNETFDRAAMDKLLRVANPKFDIGVYGAFYKLSIIITIFIQAFRYAAEPFFFERANHEDATFTYSRVMDHFMAVCMFIALVTLVYLPWIAPLAIRSASYFSHPDALKLVPILLLANIFLGAIYNLSIWYKIKEKTTLGAGISIGGALLTIALLLIFIPRFGIIAAAWTTLTVYTAMLVASYLIGQRHYPVPYRVGRILLGLAVGFGLYIVDNQLFATIDAAQMNRGLDVPSLLAKSGIVIAYSILLYLVVIRSKKT